MYRKVTQQVPQSLSLSQALLQLGTTGVVLSPQLNEHMVRRKSWDCRNELGWGNTAHPVPRVAGKLSHRDQLQGLSDSCAQRIPVGPDVDGLVSSVPGCEALDLVHWLFPK